ncbi:hypothetical protein [Embleya sp. NPDC005575]|uniref:hypothetical protein n=1 Tax=Embleya sp. NPDC005575 TaxID=3156892 RepID=UPI0033B25FAC
MADRDWADALSAHMTNGSVMLDTCQVAVPTETERKDEFMATVHRAFTGGLMHKLHVARPYDEVAGILDKDHYDTIAGVTITPWGSGALRPTPASGLRPPTTPGPGYDRQAARANVRDNYEYLPTLINRTLPRALAHPGTVEGFYELRREGWLDWHLLVAIVNVTLNMRANSAGLLSQGKIAQQQQLAREPESDQSVPVPLSALTPTNLRSTMEVAVLAIGQRRWHLTPSTQTPNSAAFKDLLVARYGYAVDDVAHRDLLSEALTADGSLLPLIDG